MTTTPATNDLDALIATASAALTAQAERTEGATDDDSACVKDEAECFRISPVHFAWYQLGETGIVGETKAIARVVIEAAHKPLLDERDAAREELAKVRQHEARVWQRIQAWNDDPTTRLEAFAITWERVEAAVREREAAREELAKTRAELDGRIAWLYRNSTRMTQMRYNAATAAGYDFARYSAVMEQPVDRDALIAYLREEIAFAEREIALVEANPATTAEPADEPKATVSTALGNDWSDLLNDDEPECGHDRAKADDTECPECGADLAALDAEPAAG